MSSTNPLVHEIHVSEIREFKKCRLSHNWKFTEQYYPKTVAKPLEFGTAYHAAKEVYYNPDTWHFSNDIKRDLAILEFVRICNEQYNAITYPTAEQKEDYAERIELGIGILTYYFGEIAPIEDVNLEPLFVEKNFSIPIKIPSTNEQLYCYCNKCAEKWSNAHPQINFHGLPVHLEGKIDLVLRDKRTGKVWVLDWKTTARIAEVHEWLELDEQITDYLIALMKLELNVAGFMYHESLKAYPKLPKENSRRYKGKLFSTDKTQDTNLDLFVATVIEYDAEAYYAGAYDEYIDWLQNAGKEFYHRETVRRTNAQLELAYNDLIEVVLEMTSPTLRVYPSPGKFNCMYCDFQQVCIGRVTGADYTYTLNTMFEKKAPYYER